MSAFLQGTTPTFVITFPAETAVSDFTALELAFYHNRKTTLHHLADVTIDSTANTATYNFTEAETLAMNPDVPFFWQVRIRTADGIFGTEKARLEVKDLISKEMIE